MICLLFYFIFCSIFDTYIFTLNLHKKYIHIVKFLEEKHYLTKKILYLRFEPEMFLIKNILFTMLIFILLYHDYSKNLYFIRYKFNYLKVKIKKIKPIYLKSKIVNLYYRYIRSAPSNLFYLTQILKIDIFIICPFQ